MSKTAVTILAATLALSFFAGLASASEKWVDQAGGSDANDGDTEATAYASLQFAIDNSVSGTVGTPSIIHVKDGTYETTGQTNQDGYTTAILIQNLDYLTIQAVSGHNPKVMPGLAGNNVSVSVQNCDHLTVDNIDSDQTIAQFDNWHVWDSDDLILRNSVFEGGEDGIDFNTAIVTALIEDNTFQDVNTGSGDEVLDFTDGAVTAVTVQDNLFSNNYRQITVANFTVTDLIIRRNIMNGTTSEEAIRLIGVSNVLVENNAIMNNMQQGIYVDNGCSNITIQHNTFFNNDQEAGPNGELRIKPDPAANSITVKNNIIYGNGSNPPFESVAAGWAGEDYNLIYNDDGSFDAQAGANTILGIPPSFVSTTPGSEDLDLQDGSMAIGAGASLGVPVDIEGETRGTPPDIGAYENPLDAPQILEVWVDDDFDSGTPGWGITHFAVIQDGIDAASEDATVSVAAGSYAERLTITKSLDLLGPQDGTDPTEPGARTNPANEAVVDITGLSLQNPNVAVEIPSGVTDVLMSGLTIIGSPVYTNPDEAVVRCWDDNLTVRENIIDGYFGFLYKGNDDFTCERNRVVVNKGGCTVQPSPATNVTITGNSFALGSSPAADAAAMYATGCDGLEISDNTASGFTGGNAAGGSNLHNVTIEGNTFTGNKKGVNFWGDTRFVSITYNDLDGTIERAIAIKGQDIDIEHNQITNSSDTGIYIGRHVIDTERVEVHYNNISGNALYGLYVDTANVTEEVDAEMNWWGDASGPDTGRGTGDKVSDGVDFDPWIGTAGGENIVCDPDPLGLSEAVSTASLDVDYLGGGTAGVRTVHIVFTWEVTDVDLTGIVQGDLFGAEPSQFFSNIGTGTATVDWSLTGLPEEINPALGPGTIFTPTFAAVAACDSDVDPEIEFTEVIFRDAYNGTISGVYARDGDITIDTNDPIVATPVYDNSLPHAEAFVKTSDTPTLSATVTDGCVATSILTIEGDFSTLVANAGWDAMAPTSLVGTTASWDFPTDQLSADGTYTVTLTATDDLGNEGSATFDITVDNTLPTAVTAVSAGPGHNHIDLTWADPSGLDDNYYAVELWRTAWGVYPEYDNAEPSYPAPPGTGTMVSGVPTGTLTSFTETFASDGSERDIYYYTVVVIDKALNKGPAVTSAQDRSTNYWLGDVAPTGPPLGNGRVFSEDISVLSGTYFKSHGEGGYNNACDVGPTDDMSRTGIPTTDDMINFEDLIVFSMNYDVDSPEGREGGAPAGHATPVALDLKVPGDVPLQPGARMVVTAVLSDEGAAVKGAHFVVHYDEQTLICRGVHEGALVADCGGFFKALVQDGTADISAAAMGRGLTLGGSGTLAELVFEVRDGSDPELSLEDVTLRNVANKDLRPTTSTIEVPLVSTDVIPTNVFLGANRPNPFVGMTHVDFGLPTAAPVNLAVYDVSGRLVRTLINGELGAGEHSVQWDRTQADGTPVPGGLYFYRLETSNQVMTRKMIVSE